LISSHIRDEQEEEETEDEMRDENLWSPRTARQQERKGFLCGDEDEDEEEDEEDEDEDEE
jgi:hypothetical protein